MYLWVILATFIAILTSYNLSVRSDMDRVYSESKASTIVTKMRMQQNALKDYLASQERARTGQAYVSYFPGDGVNTSTGDEIDIKSFLPLGFKVQTGTAAHGAPVSKVFCIDYNTGQTCQPGPDVSQSCCSEGSNIYVVTFQSIPTRWYNKQKGTPNADIIGALVKIPGYGKAVGYTIPDNGSGKVVLSGGHRKVNNFYEYEIEGDDMVNQFGHLNNQGQFDTMDYEQLEIYQPILDDADFRAARCHENYCLFAIQQIYS